MRQSDPSKRNLSVKELLNAAVANYNKQNNVRRYRIESNRKKMILNLLRTPERFSQILAEHYDKHRHSCSGEIGCVVPCCPILLPRILASAIAVTETFLTHTSSLPGCPRFLICPEPCPCSDAGRQRGAEVGVWNASSQDASLRVHLPRLVQTGRRQSQTPHLAVQAAVKTRALALPTRKLLTGNWSGNVDAFLAFHTQPP